MTKSARAKIVTEVQGIAAPADSDPGRVITSE